jgi:hypothetical protein
MGVLSHQPIRTQCLQRFREGTTHQIGIREASGKHQEAWERRAQTSPLEGERGFCRWVALRRKIAHAAELVVFEGLEDFGAAVHDEGALADDGFRDGFAAHEQEVGIGVCCYGDAVAGAGEDCEVAFAGFAVPVQEDCAVQDKERGGMAIGQGQFGGVASAKVHIPEVDGRERFGRTFMSAEFARDNAHGSRVLRERHVGNLCLEQGLVARFCAFVFGGEVDPELHHLQGSALLSELAGMEFFVNDAATGSHPLDVASADFAAAATGIAMLQLALIGDGDGFEAFVRVPTDAAAFVARRELIRRRVVEEQEGAEFTAEPVVVEHRADRESIADPVHGRTLMNAKQFLCALLGRRFYFVYFFYFSHAHRVPALRGQPEIPCYLPEHTCDVCLKSVAGPNGAVIHVFAAVLVNELAGEEMCVGG